MEQTARIIGFIGLGTMGRGMARSLLRSGFSLKIYNRTLAKSEEFTSLGAVVVDSPSAVAEDADIVITMLADGAAVRAVVDGPCGILAAISKGSVLIDCSTIDPATTLYVNEELQKRGAHMLDAPVFGSRNEAENGKLGFIVGGERKTYDRLQEVLGVMGKPFYIGVNGMGTYAKLVVNLIIAGTLQLWNEGMVLATKAGIAPEVIHEVIMSCRARSGILEMKAPQVLNRDFTPFFALRLMNKDLSLVVKAAESIDVPLPLTTHLQGIFSKCIESGLGEEDFSASIKYLERLADVTVAGK